MQAFDNNSIKLPGSTFRNVKKSILRRGLKDGTQIQIRASRRAKLITYIVALKEHTKRDKEKSKKLSVALIMDKQA